MSDSEEYESSFSDEENGENEESSNDDHFEKVNDLDELLSDESDDLDYLDHSDLNVKALKTTMIFPKKSQTASKIPDVTPIPKLKGLVLPKSTQQASLPSKIQLPKENTKKYTEDEIETITKNLPGINILNNPINYERDNIYDLLGQESQESTKDFQTRKEITLKISNIENPKIKNSTSVVLGLMIAKKLRYGINYDDNTENLIKYILSMLR